MLFRYWALTDGGKRQKGVIDADSIAIAKRRLFEQKILVTKLTAIDKKKQIRLSSTQLLNFTRELSQLLAAGLPLYESLVTIEEKMRRHKSHPLFLDLIDRLGAGDSLSKILAFYPKTFDPIYLSMIEAAEQTGSFVWAFERICDLLQKRSRLKKQLSTALAYPIFLASFCFLVTTALLLFVVPSMEAFFDDRSLHPLTQGVLALSLALRKVLPYLPILLLFPFVGIVWVSRSQRAKEQLVIWIQKLPLIRTISTQGALIRFCQSTALLLGGGTALVPALEISQKAAKHPLIQKDLLDAKEQIAQGKSFSEQLRCSPHLPPLVWRMVKTAEETGKMPQMLQSLADLYDEQLNQSLKHLTTFLQPALLILLGGIIGLVILSILLPLTDVSSLIAT